MNDYQYVLTAFTARSQAILGDNLTGVYLHGSAAMGCAHAGSDLDLLIVVKNELSDDVKRAYLDQILPLQKQAPAKGLEFSILLEAVLRPFLYPTPFELHFSRAHLDWYQSDPESYIRNMKGTDKDLAAHVTITRHRGKCLSGKAIPEVFAEVRSEDYWDSILEDGKAAVQDILRDPVSVSLNLCRVLAYRQERLILSKPEGGQWGIDHLPQRYAGLLAAAIDAYETAAPLSAEAPLLQEFAAFLLSAMTENGSPSAAPGHCSICGTDCTACPFSVDCDGCVRTDGHPFQGLCVIASCCASKKLSCCSDCPDSPCQLKQTLIAQFNALGIEDMEPVADLNALRGSFINLAFPFPSGAAVKLWDDDKIYLGNQLHKKGSDRCYGIAADETWLMVCEYGCLGEDPRLLLFKRWR